MLHIPASDILQFAINGPFAKRPLVLLFYYVDEACLLNHVLDEWCYHDILPKLLACFYRKLRATMHCVVRWDGAVIRYQLRCGFAVLDVAAWGDMAAIRQDKLTGDQSNF